MPTEELSITPDLHKMAIEAIEGTTKLHMVRFIIKGPSYSYRATRYSKKWQVSVMGKTFSNEDFILACGEAVRFVVEAHTEKYNTDDLNKLKIL